MCWYLCLWGEAKGETPTGLRVGGSFAEKGSNYLRLILADPAVLIYEVLHFVASRLPVAIIARVAGLAAGVVPNTSSL